VVDVTLLEQAMVVTGRNQSDTVNEALAQLTGNAATLDGSEQMRGRFPRHPDHTEAGQSGGGFSRFVPRYVLDTQHFIDVLKDRAASAEVLMFLRTCVAAVDFHAVVGAELLMGAFTRGEPAAIRKRFIDPFKPRRVIVPMPRIFSQRRCDPAYVGTVGSAS
jgi:hypothetical protein